MFNYFLEYTLVEQYMGQLLYLQPIHSWPHPHPAFEWQQLTSPTNTIDDMRQIFNDGFHVRVRYFLTVGKDSDNWCAVVGKVEQEGHQFDQFWIGCRTNYRVYANFTNRLHVSHCTLGPNRPNEPKMMAPSGFPSYKGYGVLGESRVIITEAIAAKDLDSIRR